MNLLPDEIKRTGQIRANRSDYITVYLISFCALTAGSSVLYNVFEFGNNDLLAEAIIILTSSILFLIFSLIKIRIENSCKILMTGLSLQDNVILCRDIMKKHYNSDSVFIDEEKGFLIFTIDSLFSWGKKITMHCQHGQILLNVKDIKAPYSLFSRRMYMRRLKQLIWKKIH